MTLKYTGRPGGSAHCPMCKEPISREAKKCPHCQSDLTENEEWQKIQQSPTAAGCMPLILAALLAAGAVLTTAAEWLRN